MTALKPRRETGKIEFFKANDLNKTIIRTDKIVYSAMAWSSVYDGKISVNIESSDVISLLYKNEEDAKSDCQRLADLLGCKD